MMILKVTPSYNIRFLGTLGSLELESRANATQIGPRSRRKRTAAARKAAAIVRPIHRPGLVRKLPGTMCVIGWVGNISGDVEATVGAPPPINRDPTRAAKCQV